MKSNKILAVTDCYFNLPDDFDGGLLDALKLLVEYLSQNEANRTDHEIDSIDGYEYLMANDDIKCSMVYDIFQWSEDDSKWKLMEHS